MIAFMGSLYHTFVLKVKMGCSLSTHLTKSWGLCQPMDTGILTMDILPNMMALVYRVSTNHVHLLKQYLNPQQWSVASVGILLPSFIYPQFVSNIELPYQ